VPPLGLDENLLTTIGVRHTLTVDDPADAEDLLARLGDPDRHIAAGAVLRAHAVLAAAGLDAEEIDPPSRVRTLAGQAIEASDAMVLDGPWLLGALPDDRVVSAGEDFALAEPLADLLDLPLASATLESIVDSSGEHVPWTELGAVVAACELLDLEIPSGGPIVHDQLTVGSVAVTWWIDRANRVHVEDSADALARALAWTTDRWLDRHTLSALITDPEPRTQLS
jgi:hypothetical protein